MALALPSIRPPFPLVSSHSSTDSSFLSLPSVALPSCSPSNDPLASFSALLASLPPIPPSQQSSSPASLVSSYVTSILKNVLIDFDLLSSVSQSLLDVRGIQQDELEVTYHHHQWDAHANNEGKDKEHRRRKELYLSLKEHFHLESQLPTPSSPPTAANLDTSTSPDLQKCLLDSTLSLLRLLRQHPQLSHVIRQAQAGWTENKLKGTFLETPSLPSPPSIALREALVKLSELVRGRLNQSPESDSEMLMHSASMSAREDNDLSLLNELNEKLSNQKAVHQTELNSLEILKKRYVNQLHAMLEQVEESQVIFERTAKGEEEKNEALFREKEKELLELRDKLNREYTEQSEESWRNEGLLQRKAHIKHEEIGKLVQHHDDELHGGYEAYTQLERVHEKEKQETEKLRGYFQRKEEHQKQLREERGVLKARRDAELFADRDKAEFQNVIERSFEAWNAKFGKKDKDKVKQGKKPKTKLTWRPPREEKKSTSSTEEVSSTSKDVLTPTSRILSPREEASTAFRSKPGE